MAMQKLWVYRSYCLQILPEMQCSLPPKLADRQHIHMVY